MTPCMKVAGSVQSVGSRLACSSAGDR